MPTKFPNQRLFLNNKHGASSWFLFIYLLFPSPAAVCNVEIDFHNVCLHRCSDFSFVRYTALVPTSISISILFGDTPFLHFQARHGQMDCLASKIWRKWHESNLHLLSSPSTVSCEDSWYDSDTGGWGRWAGPSAYSVITHELVAITVLWQQQNVAIITTAVNHVETLRS